MIRKAFKMKLHPGALEEYTNRHNPIWETLEITLKEQGAHDYSIFYDEDTNTLFGYVNIECEERWKNIANTTVCRDWWEYMADIMETNEDNSPIAQELTEVFYLK
ncbi:L-rhamnose mutarotase [Marinoscillum furvescens]|uniref:L-rhamnose mutarotase n=1 Tax=Marinoscillum furvescens DSM 4134 TaxID=1122208 RepID=A0A3D9L1U8_MARFU|nr:L-rhamnose mutarotase [Marinoscillum furvescens]RED98345.1 L-rhamnose mutarotase [Marinoscillum furvescens DSM 4134]